MIGILKSAVMGSRGQVSASRICMLTACFALAASVIGLTIASLLGHDVGVALGAVAIPLAGIGGYSYTDAKKTATGYNVVNTTQS